MVVESVILLMLILCFRLRLLRRLRFGRLPICPFSIEDASGSLRHDGGDSSSSNDCTIELTRS
ncbi:hypothetical protein LguiB_018030 [Lonicera macranthoides]